jgi:ABC-type microcin C transport system permease subunit YejE
MKLFITLFIIMLSSNLYSQDKSNTVDKALETTTTILKLFEKKNEKKIETVKQEKVETVTNEKNMKKYVGKLHITNSSTRRITITITGTEKLEDYKKSYTLGIDDKETINNLQFGNYLYVAKFEDGVIAKMENLKYRKKHLLKRKQ